MQPKNLAVVLIAAATPLIAGRAHAAFTGLSMESYNTVINGDPRTVWRVYANFTAATEGVSSVGPIGTAMTLQTYAYGVPSGSFFAGGNPTPPTQSEIDNNPNAAHRSFYTINLTVQDQNPDPLQFPLLNVTMPPITGNTVYAAQDSAATTTTPNSPFALAGWNGQNRVLILQLQVSCYHCVRGTIGLNTIGSGGAEAVVVAQFLNLGCVPAPSALALLAIGILRGTRRRRNIL